MSKPKRTKEKKGGGSLISISDLLASAKPVDMSKWYEEQEKLEKQRREREAREAKIEEERIKNLSCPVCKSTNKHRHTESTSNGIMGPGYHSRITSDYYICMDCGIHYTDLNKKK